MSRSRCGLARWLLPHMRRQVISYQLDGPNQRCLCRQSLRDLETSLLASRYVITVICVVVEIDWYKSDNGPVGEYVAYHLTSGNYMAISRRRRWHRGCGSDFPTIYSGLYIRVEYVVVSRQMIISRDPNPNTSRCREESLC